jgi:hypothetical protein
MLKAEFLELLRVNRAAAIALLIDRKVDEWLNDGPDEVKRALALWASRPELPSLSLGDDESLVEMAENCDLVEEK